MIYVLMVCVFVVLRFLNLPQIVLVSRAFLPDGEVQHHIFLDLGQNLKHNVPFIIYPLGTVESFGRVEG